MFEDFKTLSDIKDFQAKLVTEFTTRSLIRIFRNKEVHPPKKQPNVNTSDVTENDEKDSENNPKVTFYRQEYAKERIQTVKDWENAKELAEAFIKLSNDSNKDSTLFKERGVIDLCREKQVKVCGECLSSNCHLKQSLSAKHKVDKQFVNSCKGKH